MKRARRRIVSGLRSYETQVVEGVGYTVLVLKLPPQCQALCIKRASRRVVPLVKGQNPKVVEGVGYAILVPKLSPQCQAVLMKERAAG